MSDYHTPGPAMTISQDDLEAAVDELLSQHPTTVAAFLAAFESRAKYPWLSESKPGDRGLKNAFRGALRSYGYAVPAAPPSDIAVHYVSPQRTRAIAIRAIRNNWRWFMNSDRRTHSLPDEDVVTQLAAALLTYVARADQSLDADPW